MNRAFKLTFFVKTLVVFATVSFSLFFLARSAFAALYINEFSSETDPDWVEIYNSGPDSTDLSLYRLRDNTATNKVDLSGDLEAGGFMTFDWSNKLNKSGDIIKLLLVSDEANPIDQVSYGDVGDDVIAPLSNQSAGRSSDGSGTWGIFSSPTKGSTNNSSTPEPTITPTSVPTSTPTRIPTPTKTPTPAPASKQSAATPVPTFVQNSAQTKISTQDLNEESVASSDAWPTAVLGESAQDSKKSSSPTTSVKGVSGNNTLSVILIGAGIICLSACGILAYRTYKKSKNDIS